MNEQKKTIDPEILLVDRMFSSIPMHKKDEFTEEEKQKKLCYRKLYKVDIGGIGQYKSTKEKLRDHRINFNGKL